MPYVFDHDPSQQEIFDEACNHFAKQKRRAKDHLGCAYRGAHIPGDPPPCECAVGHFLPDPKFDGDAGYRKEMERQGVENLWNSDMREYLPSWFGRQLDLLCRLQRCHDVSSSTNELLTALCSCAAEFRLADCAIGQIKEWR